MPMANGKYVSPTWVNGGPPALNASNLQDLTSSVERIDNTVPNDLNQQLGKVKDASGQAYEYVTTMQGYDVSGSLFPNYGGHKTFNPSATILFASDPSDNTKLLIYSVPSMNKIGEKKFNNQIIGLTVNDDIILIGIYLNSNNIAVEAYSYTSSGELTLKNNLQPSGNDCSNTPMIRVSDLNSTYMVTYNSNSGEVSCIEYIKSTNSFLNVRITSFGNFCSWCGLGSGNGIMVVCRNANRMAKIQNGNITMINIPYGAVEIGGIAYDPQKGLGISSLIASNRNAFLFNLNGPTNFVNNVYISSSVSVYNGYIYGSSNTYQLGDSVIDITTYMASNASFISSPSGGSSPGFKNVETAEYYNGVISTPNGEKIIKDYKKASFGFMSPTT